MSIRLLDDSGMEAGAIGSAGLGLAFTVDSSGRPVVATAVQDRDGDLKLVTWRVSQNGKVITRLGDSGQQAGAVGLVAMAGASGNRVITAVRSASGSLLLIAWQVDPNTGAVSRLGHADDEAGAISRVAAIESPLGD